jgi:hypothetical protein
VSNDETTNKKTATMVLMAMLASAETRFEQLGKKLAPMPMLSPEGTMRVRAELGALLVQLDRLHAAVDEQARRAKDSGVPSVEPRF